MLVLGPGVAFLLLELIDTAGARGRARGHAGDAAARAAVARPGAGAGVPGADDLAQSRADPRDGAARYAGALSRVVSADRSGRSSIRCC